MAKHEDDFIPTRRSLLSRLKNWDDNASWRDFFNIYWKLIYSTAIKAGLTHHEAEEVLQETVITVTKKIKDLKYDPALGSFKGWLLNTTRWKIMDEFRKRVRHPQDVRSATEIDEGIVDDRTLGRIDQTWEEEWQKNLVDAAMQRVKSKVSAKQYQIFDLYVVKGWSVKKVCETLDISRAQVYLAKHRITPLIKKEVEELEKNLM